MYVLDKQTHQLLALIAVELIDHGVDLVGEVADRSTEQIATCERGSLGGQRGTFRGQLVVTAGDFARTRCSSGISIRPAWKRSTSRRHDIASDADAVPVNLARQGDHALAVIVAVPRESTDATLTSLTLFSVVNARGSRSPARTAALLAVEPHYADGPVQDGVHEASAV